MTEVKTGDPKYLLKFEGPPQAKPIEQLPEKLPHLPANIHPFRDPRHPHLVNELENRRIILLTSYQESAAYAAAYSLVNDEHFIAQEKKAFFATRKRDRERSDLDLLALSDEQFLRDKPQIILIEIDSWCTLLDCAFALGPGVVGRIQNSLEDYSSYLILAVNEEALGDKAEKARERSAFPYYSVSHLRYLLTRDLADRAEDLEKRLLAAMERGANPIELRELYSHVADRLAEGEAAFDEFLQELEQSSSLPVAARKTRLQAVQLHDVFREDSEIHRAAAFVATYFPDLGQGDFDWLVLALLGDETTTVERLRQVVGRDGIVTTVREEIEERWADRWRRSADGVFRDCHLRTVASPDGSWIVDFGEPYLRRELRAHLERHFPWYLKRQCKALQDLGALFAIDISTTAVEGLVRLFVERAVVDPAGFGSAWLLDLVRGLTIQLKGDPPSDSPEAVLVWMLDKLAVEAQLLAHFRGRLAFLIREMLDRESLRRIVRDFFDFLIAARQHDALLEVVLDLARRLRFAPHFDPLVWMRRLLDEGSEAVRERTAERLITLARDSGPRIYEFLSAIRNWLPEAGRPPDRFSLSNRVALEFPFAYCFSIAASLPSERFGAWPSRHPLFYALSSNPTEARKEIANFVEWVLDPRGAALETADQSEPMRTAEVVRIGYVAELIEHWAWVLQGDSDNGSREGLELFTVIVEEVDRRMTPREHSWLQRSWQRRMDDYLRQASTAGSPGSSERLLLVKHRARLDQLRTRFTKVADQQSSGQTPPTTGGMAP